MSADEYERIARDAMSCRICFEDLGFRRSLIDLPQPRPVGSLYWESHPRVALLFVNPGRGAGWADEENTRLRALLHTFASGGSAEPVFEHQQRDMENWGRGRFWEFFVRGVGLDPRKLAVLNVAWCSTDDNGTSSRMLRTCFERHTSRALAELEPDVVILSGGATHSFERYIERIAPGSHLVPALHFAHRKGRLREREEIEPIRSELSRIPRRSCGS